MIRLTCAWALLLLALSPFTAPYSTCDLASLMNHPAPHAVSYQLQQSAGIAAATTTADDAFSISPFAPRHSSMVRLDAAAILMVAGVHRDVPAAANRSRTRVAHAGQGHTGQQLILRL